MSRRSRLTPILLVALAGLLPMPAPAQTAPDAAAAASAADDSAEGFPVLAVTKVEALRSSHAPALDIVVVQAVTSTPGWTDGTLVPLTRGTPSDGVLDLVFVAQPPRETGELTGFGMIQAILPVAAEHPFKAIRVRGAGNAVLLRSLPGTAEAKPPADSCASCVGKFFVAKGGSAPSGVAAGQLVREDDLPKAVRIVRPDDGIADLQANPNRLTLVIGEDGRIVDAAWE